MLTWAGWKTIFLTLVAAGASLSRALQQEGVGVKRLLTLAAVLDKASENNSTQLYLQNFRWGLC